MKVHSANNLTRTLSLITAISFLLLVFYGTTPSYSQTELLLPQKGMCYVTWDKDRFATRYSDDSLAKLASLGVEYLAICVTQYQEKYNSTEIKPTSQTPSDSSIKHVISASHKLGLKVMLKPHIDLIDQYDGTYWRADIGFARDRDWEEWFREYTKFIKHYARMAEKMGVEILCVGTELSFASQREADWRNVISEVRKVYSGKLVYAANWDNFRNIKFWNALDFVGIDAYFPLSYKSSPDVEELKAGWEKWKYEIEAWLPEVNMSVIFTEIGYSSTPYAPSAPWESTSGGNPDAETQARCYQAFFETIWNETWLAGVYWWKWDTNVKAGGKYNRRFTPQNKPAEKIIENNYKKTFAVDKSA